MFRKINRMPKLFKLRILRRMPLGHIPGESPKLFGLRPGMAKMYLPDGINQRQM